MASDKALSWVFAEEFVEENDILTQARETATDLGAEPVSTGVGATLRFLAATCGAKAVLEIGTGAGVSGLWLLQGMSADGVLTTIDHEVEFHKYARRAFTAAGIPSQRTRLIAGRALDVLPRMAARGYDMMVIDAPADEIPDYLDHALRVLRPGGLIVIVHALWHDQVADPAQRDEQTVMMRELAKVLASSEQFVPAMLPVGDGLLAAVKRI